MVLRAALPFQLAAVVTRGQQRATATGSEPTPFKKLAGDWQLCERRQSWRFKPPHGAQPISDERQHVFWRPRLLRSLDLDERDSALLAELSLHSVP
jgi:hypothetical protein